MNSFIEEISKNSNIKSVTQTNTIPGNVFYQNVNRIKDEDKVLYDLVADNKYFETMDLKLIEGRIPSINPENRKNEIILNQSAVKELGWEDPIGRTDIWGREIIGVVEDFNYMSMHQPILPMMIRFDPFFTYATIKFNTLNTAQVLFVLESKWNEFFTSGIFEYHFFDDSFQQLYEAEIRFGKLAVYLSFIALFISLLGMAGVVSFVTKRKIKEIGVRKVNGAKTAEILTMLNKDFIKWVAIAFVVACPIAYYAMNLWLENFAYKTNLSWWIFALAGLLALGIALLTVSWQSWRAATRNPVDALRYE
jgi:putative ABC transport system permease protein